jgi:hypothetical protein
MSDDLLSELTLIDLSRVQREALDRWVPILLAAGETEVAEEVWQIARLREVGAV